MHETIIVVIVRDVGGGNTVDGVKLSAHVNPRAAVVNDVVDDGIGARHRADGIPVSRTPYGQALAETDVVDIGERATDPKETESVRRERVDVVIHAVAEGKPVVAVPFREAANTGGGAGIGKIPARVNIRAIGGNGIDAGGAAKRPGNAAAQRVPLVAIEVSDAIGIGFSRRAEQAAGVKPARNRAGRGDKAEALHEIEGR